MRLAPPFAALADPQIITDDRLTRDSLLRLAAGQAIAIVVPGYYPAELCRDAAGRLLDDAWFGEYENVPGVYKWGLNTYEGLSSVEREKRYFDRAVPAIQALRETWRPHLSPIDRLRLELQESWPAGANMEYLDGRALFVGQARVFQKGDGALPHQDFLPWELIDLRKSGSAEGTELVGQLTANLYLRTPETGGELELWSAGYDHADYDERRAEAGSYGLDRDRLPEPTAVIKPADGMLILFHSTRPHAVRPSQGTSRVALSCFIGVRGLDHPLTYWS